MKLKAPFPYFGGKTKIAAEVWSALGNVDNYCEPFFGSGATMLLRKDPPGIETLNDVDCIAPETRILRSDLTWGRAGEIMVGDSLLGFDEENGGVKAGLGAPDRYRHWRHASVLAVRRVVKPCYRLTFDDGTTVVASADHLWLGGSHATGGRGWRWQKTESLVCNRETQRSWILKVADVVEREESHDAGWLAGMYDGEGHVLVGPGSRITLSQKPGKVLDRAECLLRERGFNPSVLTGTGGVSRIQLKGGMRAVLRLLMLVRPERLVSRFADLVPRASLYGRDHQAVGLIGKEFLGDQEVVAIQTDSRTFIAEGLASHNCYVVNFWRSTQRDPEAVVSYADGPVIEVDLHARHRWLVLSDDAVAFRERMKRDPEYFDPKIAGWWCWGLCSWIGSGWCDAAGGHQQAGGTGNKGLVLGSHGHGGGNGIHAAGESTPSTPNGPPGGSGERMPRIDGGKGQYGHGVHADGGSANWKQMPLLNVSQGVHAQGDPGDTRRPQLADARDIGRGVNASPPGEYMLSQRMPRAPRPTGDGIGGNYDGVLSNPHHLGTCAARRAWLLDWFGRLRDRLRNVRVCCGDWLRVCDSESVTTRLGVTGIFFDPPYPRHQKGGKASRSAKLYASDSATKTPEMLRDDLLAYCRERGSNRQMRIVVAGYEGDGYEALVADHGWTEQAWAADGGYGNRSAVGKANAKRERLWISPHCAKERSLFS